jgi:membrane protease YdiL (CAAX protease family)
MKNSLLILIKNPFFMGYLFLYLIFLFLLHFVEQFSMGEPLAVLVIVGIGFSGLAFLFTKSSEPFHISIRGTKKEMLAMVISLILAMIYLTWGKDAANVIFYRYLEDSLLVKLVIDLVQKLVFFVIIPLFVFMKYFEHSMSDFGIQFRSDQNRWRSHLRVLFGMSLGYIIFNYFLGEGARPIRDGQFSAGQLIIGLPISFLWLLIEVGLVEEFFFRAFIQSRLAAFFRSEVTGIVLSCLIFGLAHAPGLILRGTGIISPVGESPSILLGVGYSIVILSVTGFCLGIVWARTRNLFVLMVIHAAGDLLPNFGELVEAFHI